jgi:hypothetical protein
VVRLTLPRRVVMHAKPATGIAVTPQTAVAEATESAAPRFAGVFAIVLAAGLLVQALVDHDSYRHPVVPVVVWLGMLAAAAWLLPRASAGDVRTRDAVAAIGVAAVAVTAIDLDRQLHQAVMTVDWTVLGTAWLLALIALTTPVWLWVPGSALVMSIHTVFILHELGFGPRGLSRLSASCLEVHWRAAVPA